MGYTIKEIFNLTLALIIISILLPIGVIYIASIDNAVIAVNGTYTAWTDAVDPAITTLFTVVLPIVVCIGIIVSFIKSKSAS